MGDGIALALDWQYRKLSKERHKYSGAQWERGTS